MRSKGATQREGGEKEQISQESGKPTKEQIERDLKKLKEMAAEIGPDPKETSQIIMKGKMWSHRILIPARPKTRKKASTAVKVPVDKGPLDSSRHMLEGGDEGEEEAEGDEEEVEDEHDPANGEEPAVHPDEPQTDIIF